jgi:hypothetical protein
LESAAPVQVAGVPDLKVLLEGAIKETTRDTGWASLAAVGGYVGKNNASFDARNYGFRRLSELVRKQEYLEVKELPDASGSVHLLVKLK